MTNAQFERAQIAKFAALTTEELERMAERADFTLADEISNELDRRASR